MSPSLKILAWLQIGDTYLMTLHSNPDLLKYLEITPGKKCQLRGEVPFEVKTAISDRTLLKIADLVMLDFKRITGLGELLGHAIKLIAPFVVTPISISCFSTLVK